MKLADVDSKFPFQRMDCYRVAREIAERVHAARIADAELRDHATRAAKGCFLQLCEGLPEDRPAMRRRYFSIADGWPVLRPRRQEATRAEAAAPAPSARLLLVASPPSGGSVHEVAGAIDLAAAIGALDAAEADRIAQLALRLRAMIRGLRR